MIGQTKLKTLLSAQVENNNLPRFIILLGEKGQGKKTVANWLADELDGIKYLVGTKIVDIREMLENAYKIVDTTIYIIADADEMSNEAKNAMLKVVEEPPNNAYFILTLQSLDNTLDTIKGRAVSYFLESYSQDELLEYYNFKRYCHAQEAVIQMLNIAENPYEIDFLANNDVTGFVDFVNLVVDNIAVTSGANAFKIGDKLAFKGEEDKYDLKLFWRAFNNICIGRYLEDVKKYCKAVQITSKYIQELKIRGINLQNTFDMWLLDIRKEWM